MVGATDVVVFSPGGGYGTVYFQPLRCYPIYSDSCGHQGVVHRRSVPSPYPPPSFSGEGRASGPQPLYILPCRLCPTLPVLLQGFPYCISQPHDPSLISPMFSPRGDSLVDNSPRCLRNPRIVARRPFVRIWYSAPQLQEDLVRPRPCLMSGRTKRDARPSPQLV